MSELDVERALRQSFADLAVADAAHTSLPNREFSPPADASTYYELSFVSAGRDPNTLGQNGEDRYTGFMQVNVNAKQNTGSSDTTAKAQALTAFYTAGKQFEYNGQVVTVRKSEMNPPMPSGVRWVQPVTVYWYADIQR